MAEDRSKDFVDALVQDPANPPQLQVLTGYRGRSAKEGHTRLYLDPELTGWVDIPDDAILLTRETQDEHGLGKSLVWVKLDAQIEQGPQKTGGTGAAFLQGQVAQDLGARAGQAQIPATQLGCPTHAPMMCLQTPPRLCPRTLSPEACPSLGIACTYVPLCPQHTLPPELCPTLGFTCTALPPCPPRTQTPEQCPTLGFTCTALPPCPPRTIDPQICPSAVDACPSRLCPTRDPQLCPVATPNPGCVPGGIGNPGGPVEARQMAAAPQPAPAAHAQIQWHQTPLCPVRTHDLSCWITRPEICQPVSPWCPWTFPITGPGPGTTPQMQITIIGGAQGGGFAPAAQPLAAAQPIPIPQTQFCPQPSAICPVTFNCPPTQNVACPLTSNPHVCLLPHTVAGCLTINPICPPVTLNCGGRF